MTLVEKIGQKMMIGISGTYLCEEDRALISKYKICNVILFREGLADKAQAARLCGQIHEAVYQATGHRAFIALDQEGGIVTRLPGDMTNIPGAMALASAADGARLIDQSARLTARELREIGANINLAPVLDVNSNPANPVIGVRSYGAHASRVCRLGLEAVAAYMDEGVMCCAKHFPGHGDTATDSHLTLPTVDKALEQLWDVELAPFRGAIGAGIPAIMTSHILFPRLEADGLPATMSHRILTGLLRRQLGFEGLIITDAMEMGAIKDFFGTAEGCVKAAGAGADLICVCRDRQLIIECIQRLTQAVSQGEVDPAMIDQSVNRIVSMREKWAFVGGGNIELCGCDAHRQANQGFFDSTMTHVQSACAAMPPLGDKPCFVGFRPYRVTQAGNVAMDSVGFAGFLAGRLGGLAFDLSAAPDDEELAPAIAAAQGATCVVAGTYNGRQNPAQLKFVNALAQKGLPVICVAVRNPYDLLDANPKAWNLAAYQHSENSLAAVARVLAGQVQPVSYNEIDLPWKGAAANG